MALSNFWGLFLLFLSIMKQTHEDYDTFFEMVGNDIPLRTLIDEYRMWKQRTENFYDEIEVCIYKYIYKYINHSFWNDIY